MPAKTNDIAFAGDGFQAEMLETRRDGLATAGAFERANEGRDPAGFSRQFRI
jgi:hypothetical protein